MADIDTQDYGGRLETGYNLFSGQNSAIRRAPHLGAREIGDVRPGEVVQPGAAPPELINFRSPNLTQTSTLMEYDPQMEARRRALAGQLQAGIDTARSRGSAVINPYMSADEQQARGVQNFVANAQLGRAGGQGPSLAAMQASQAGDQGLMQALAARARGMSNGANANALAGAGGQLAQQAGMARAGEQYGALGAGLGAASQLRNQGLAEAQLRQQIEQGNIGLEGAYGNAQYGMGAGAANRQAEAMLAEQQLGLRAGLSNQAANAAAYASQVAEANKINSGIQNTVGGLLSGGASIAAHAVSDMRAKTDIHSAGGPVGPATPGSADSFLNALNPYEYRYKNPRAYGQGERLGVMAQDLEKARPELVSKGPGTKKIDTAGAVSATLAGLGRLNERLAAVEQGGRLAPGTSADLMSQIGGNPYAIAPRTVAPTAVAPAAPASAVPAEWERYLRPQDRAALDRFAAAPLAISQPGGNPYTIAQTAPTTRDVRSHAEAGPTGDLLSRIGRGAAVGAAAGAARDVRRKGGR